MRKKNLINGSIYLTSVLLLIIIVQIFSLLINNDVILPSVFTIISDFFTKIVAPKTYLYITNTLLNLLLSLIISFIIGMILGILGGLFNPLRVFLKPWITILRSIPVVSSLVIIMILAGFSKTPFVLSCLTIVPIIYEGFCNGVRNIDKDIMDVWKLNSNLNLRVIFRVYIPMILGYIKTAFILALGLGIKVVIMAEYFAGDKGTLGEAIIPAANMLDYTSVYSYSIIMILLVIMLESLPKLVAKLYNYYKFNLLINKKNKI